eukprot:scaffold3755_cov52-Cylindrotheca_fusiformis.AAC.5
MQFCGGKLVASRSRVFGPLDRMWLVSECHLLEHRSIPWLCCALTLNMVILFSGWEWVFDKGKGHICIDCTNGPIEQEGSANTYIPNPNPNMEECPPVYYQSALNRLIEWVMSMRMVSYARKRLEENRNSL